MKYSYFSDEEQEEPCEGRLSSTVLWEGRGETPLPDPIIYDFENTKQTNPQEKSIKLNVAL